MTNPPVPPSPASPPAPASVASDSSDALSVVAGSAAPEVADYFASASAHLVISGALAQPQRLGLDALRSLPAIASGPVIINTLRTGRILRTIGDFRGTTLASVLGSVELVLPQPADFKRMVIIARADDGYAAVFSWHEVFNSPLADRLIVAYAQDGQPLDAEQGPLLLVAAADRATGPRHVKRLSNIEARLLSL